MSSERDEVVVQTDQSSEQLRAEIPPLQPPEIHREGPNEHAKPKRRGRRGKKRKQRKDSGGTAPCPGDRQECGADHPADCEKHCFSWDSEEEDVELEDYHSFGDIIIRPVDVPKAPENSTQFIIDDHDECRLYMSFETPNPYLASYLSVEEDNSEIIEPVGVDAAYVDIDYEYESPHDFDNSAYYDREFELSYKNNRYDELLRLPRNDLVSGLQNLENRLRDLNEDLVKEDPDPTLETLQSELLDLQEKHSLLKEQGTSLMVYLGKANRLPAASVAEVEKSDVQEDAGLNELILQYPKEPEVQEEDPLCSQRQDPCSRVCVDASNKENACCEKMAFQEQLQVSLSESRHIVSMHSCGVLRDSEYHECEDAPLNDELNVVTV